jgi:hypothetical protein
MPRERLELSDIIRKYGDEFRKGRNLSQKQKCVLSAITNCRTERLGYHLDQCPECNYREISYNSCRDRHCPKCQGIARRQWVEKRNKQILPVPYYHIVFTVPSGLFPFSLYNKELIYNLLFDSAAATLKQFGEDPLWLGGKIGFFGILHTWGQTMWHHPHIHFIVAGGARDKEGKWITPKHNGRFLFPVRGLSKIFRGKFMKGLETALMRDEFVIPEELRIQDKNWEARKFLRSLVQKEWVVYCKSPFTAAEYVVEYISRYTNRVAISNSRLTDIEDNRITFKYRDYKDNKKPKTMTLRASEFLQRFLWHILPEGFTRIRHYGFLANGKAEKACREIRKEIVGIEIETETSESAFHGCICRNCGAGIMVVLQIITASGQLIIHNRPFMFNST